jgi:putative membrane protein
MQRAILLVAAAATAMSLAACQKQKDQAAGAASTTANSAPVSGTQDATSAAVGATSAATVGSVSTDEFVSNASQSDMYEIQAGQIAEQKGQSKGVKDFGKMMVADHTAMSKEMAPAVTAANQKPSPDLDQRRKGLLDNLKGAPADRFDKEYLDQQEAAHKEALTLMQGYADHGSDAGLKAAAAKAIPKVQAHLDKVHELQQGGAAAAPAKK